MDVCDTLFICGNLSRIIRKFNGQTKIEQVCECVRQTFQESLPASYRIVYYDSKTKLFVDLGNQLKNGSNPFHVNSSNGTNGIHLYIVSDTHSQTGSEDDQIVCHSIYDDNSLSTNDDVLQTTSTMNNRLLMVTSSSTNLQEIPNRSKRLYFSLDVKPNQRDIYKSDQFNVRKEKSNGRIARVQGWKRDDQKMLQVLPRLQIPSIDFQSNVILLVVVVAEELDNGMRIWYKHPHKGFLPEGYEKDSEPINPIIFNLNQNNVTNTGEFILSLQMITKWNKTQREREEVHRLNDQKTRELHSANHETNSPRLLCVLQRNGVIDWDTCCLSDFIRAPKPSRERSSSMNNERSNSPDRKRSKTAD